MSTAAICSYMCYRHSSYPYDGQNEECIFFTHETYLQPQPAQYFYFYSKTKVARQQWQ